MIPESVLRRVRLLVLFCVLAMTLLVTPWLSLDPINLPKFVVLVTCAFAATGSLLPYIRRTINSDERWLGYAIVFFLISLLTVMFFSETGILQQVYGTYGRNTGFLTYACLAAILFIVALVSNRNFAMQIIDVLILTGIINAAYGMVQWFGIDPIDWSNPYDPILGTLGNPNFVSAYLGISGLASFALLLEVSRRPITRLLLSVGVCVSLFVIFQSKSLQGILIFALGITLVLFFRIKHFLNVYLRYGYWLFVLSGISIGMFGIFNKGPLAAFLYQDSITYRGDYWKAGWNMTAANPFTGIGLDSYENWYRVSRTAAAALRRGPDMTSNSAHNVFLDISSNGGFLLLFAYLLIFAIIVKSAAGVLRKSQSYDAVGIGLVSTWAAYVMQSVISVNQLGLAIWGWVLGGAIIGYNSVLQRPVLTESTTKKNKRSEHVPAVVVLSGSICLVLGFIFSIWPMAQDVNFRRALESGDATKIVAAAKEFPRDQHYYVYAAQILQDNKLYADSLELLKIVIEANPRNFKAWQLYSQNDVLNVQERALAKARMKELDPFNNSLEK